MGDKINLFTYHRLPFPVVERCRRCGTTLCQLSYFTDGLLYCLACHTRLTVAGELIDLVEIAEEIATEESHPMCQV